MSRSKIDLEVIVLLVVNSQMHMSPTFQMLINTWLQGSKCHLKQFKKCIHATLVILVIGACSWFEFGVHSLEFLWLVLIFEWCVIKWGSQTNIKQTCVNNFFFGLCARGLVTIAALKPGGGQYDHLRRKDACIHFEDD